MPIRTHKASHCPYESQTSDSVIMYYPTMNPIIAAETAIRYTVGQSSFSDSLRLVK